MAETMPRPKPEPKSATHPRELAMSAAWNAALQREVSTTDSRQARIIYHGHWSNGFGPDFKGALLDFGDGKLISGDIELHHRASDWVRHGHNLDTHYNDVVLHVVSINDLPETRCDNGRIIPMALLKIPEEVLFTIDRHLPQLWDQLGGSVCAVELSETHPDIIRQAIQALGDKRLHAKATLLEAEILEHGVQAVYMRRLFGAFGYSANRAPMEHLAELVLRYDLHERPNLNEGDGPSSWLIGALLGMGGFLPLTPTDAHAAGILPEDQYRIERAWRESASGFANDFVSATSWEMARVRPANHPAYRIVQLATLLARTNGDPWAPILDCLRMGKSPVAPLRESTTRPWHPEIGTARAIAITASVVLPIALATAAIEGDEALEDAAFTIWASLPMGAWTQPAKRALRQVTGGPTVRRLGERGHQGLLQLDRELCAPRACNQCPIAEAVIRDQTR